METTAWVPVAFNATYREKGVPTARRGTFSRSVPMTFRHVDPLDARLAFTVTREGMEDLRWRMYDGRLFREVLGKDRHVVDTGRLSSGFAKEEVRDLGRLRHHGWRDWPFAVQAPQGSTWVVDAGSVEDGPKFSKWVTSDEAAATAAAAVMASVSMIVVEGVLMKESHPPVLTLRFDRPDGDGPYICVAPGVLGVDTDELVILPWDEPDAAMTAARSMAEWAARHPGIRGLIRTVTDRSGELVAGPAATASPGTAHDLVLDLALESLAEASGNLLPDSVASADPRMLRFHSTLTCHVMEPDENSRDASLALADAMTSDPAWAARYRGTMAFENALAVYRVTRERLGELALRDTPSYAPG